MGRRSGTRPRLAGDHDARANSIHITLVNPLSGQPAVILKRTTNASTLPHSTPSFLDTCSYLNEFYVRHNIIDQRNAALAAALLLPSMGGSQELQLPAPRFRKWKQLAEPSFISSNDQSQHDWMHQGHHLDKLLTMNVGRNKTIS